MCVLWEKFRDVIQQVSKIESAGLGHRSFLHKFMEMWAEDTNLMPIEQTEFVLVPFSVSYLLLSKNVYSFISLVQFLIPTSIGAPASPQLNVCCLQAFDWATRAAKPEDPRQPQAQYRHRQTLAWIRQFPAILSIESGG